MTDSLPLKDGRPEVMNEVKKFVLLALRERGVDMDVQIKYINAPKQTNLFDCGIYTIKNIKIAVESGVEAIGPKSYTAQNIFLMRKKLAEEVKNEMERVGRNTNMLPSILCYPPFILSEEERKIYQKEKSIQRELRKLHRFQLMNLEIHRENNFFITVDSNLQPVSFIFLCVHVCIITLTNLFVCST
jgi:hypothetical protein